MSAVNIAEEMNIAIPDRADATTTHPTRSFLWSIRRELWENPSILVAPAAVACFVVLATLFAAVRYTGQILARLQIDGVPPSTLAAAPLLTIPLWLGITMVGVAIFYSLDALYSERRDRSILFWKSLPVSDTTTVLSKMAVPMVLLPIVTFIVAVVAEILIFLIESIAFLTHHVSLSSAWAGLHVFSLVGSLAYPLTVVTLWYAPIYAWLLLVSARARRAPLLWAVIPFFVLSIFERIAFHTKYVSQFIANRFNGVFQVAYSKNYTARNIGPNFRAENYNGSWTPGHFLATPALWGGLLFAALALILIIRLRRSSDPI
jgi:ABC-2 type transport system permease protein